MHITPIDDVTAEFGGAVYDDAGRVTHFSCLSLTAHFQQPFNGAFVLEAVATIDGVDYRAAKSLPGARQCEPCAPIYQIFLAGTLVNAGVIAKEDKHESHTISVNVTVPPYASAIVPGQAQKKEPELQLR